jgi:sporulation protein YlmC with PRC-barrel domain
MHVFRDLLDKQIVDREEERVGRVDGIIAEIREGAPPRVIQVELGFVTIARRIHRRFETLAEAAHKRWSVRRSARYHIDWSNVMDVNVHHVKVDVKVEETPAFDWERWLRRHVIGRIPGASAEE